MLDCALEGNRLCQLTMANKHLHGIDGIPVDPEQAYGTISNICFISTHWLGKLDTHER